MSLRPFLSASRAVQDDELGHTSMLARFKTKECSGKRTCNEKRCKTDWCHHNCLLTLKPCEVRGIERKNSQNNSQLLCETGDSQYNWVRRRSHPNESHVLFTCQVAHNPLPGLIPRLLSLLQSPRSGHLHRAQSSTYRRPPVLSSPTQRPTITTRVGRTTFT